MADKDIHHAVAHAFAFEDAGEDPERVRVLGPDRATNVLEIIVLVKSTGDRLVIHAMRARPIHDHLMS